MRPTALATALLALLASLLVAATPAHAEDPPPRPSDAQISAAEAARQALAVELGTLQARAATLRGQITGLQTAADTAVARYQQTTQDVMAALAAADAAKTALTTATAKVDQARTRLNRVARDSYQTGSSNARGAGLLFSRDGDADFALAAARYLADRQAGSVDALEVATVAASNAETSRREALATAEALQKQADAQQQTALAALAGARTKQAELTTTLDATNKQAAAASAKLSGLKNQRAAYDAYLARVRAQEEAERRAREAAALAAAQAAAAEAARLNAEKERGEGGSGYVPVTVAPTPTADGTWSVPVKNYFISSGFGMRSGGFHYGLDFAAANGEPMYAVGPGTVVAAGPADGFGNWVVIDHGGANFSVYGHMATLVVGVGQQVNSSTLIAYVGSEGQSSGPHLHFEVRIGSYGWSSTAVDPVVWLAQRGINP